MADIGSGSSMVTIDVEELEEIEMSMNRSLQTLGKKPKKKELCTIYRVFHSVRKEHEKYYDPQIVAIGPLHHNDDALKPMEPLKWRYLRLLLRRSPEKNKLQNYISRVNEVRTEARSYYSEPVEPDDSAFVEMMVLDGCFLLEFLVNAYTGDNERHLSDVRWNLPLLRSDMLLLENQIPFPVLELLFDSSDIPILAGLHGDGSSVTLTNLVVSYVTRNKLETLPEVSNGLGSVHHHLLHVLHASIRPTGGRDPPGGGRRCCGHAAISTSIKRMESIAAAPLLWLLSCFLNCQMPLNCCGSCGSCSEETPSRAPRWIPTATHLQDSGVKFRRRKDAASFLDVRFDKEAGVMEIPMLPIQEATISQFRNLIAFEQCCPASGSYFTSHATLMNSLIDTAADVAVLKGKHIVESKLGQDQEVAELFNNLCRGAYLDYEEHHHRELFRDVVAYSNIERHKWRAGLMHDYFANPWAIISLFAAVLLLCLTMTQTFYAVFAYHRPP
ncbi:UPF0481 protein-like [Iris pallida]|uniref:UPF0481 protein-like n=1 Tax=Iris pallida TaxID=29817 RepID=A0AAX6DIL3_IRIPA|nr:UPF0481 protein-like [Iris pallida]